MAHLNTKMAQMGLKTPYPKLDNKFFNDFQGYVENLNAGHRGTGEAYALGTEEYPSEPDRSHVPYRLKKNESDFLNAVLNNAMALASNADRHRAD